MNDKNIETPIPTAEQPKQFHVPMWVLTALVSVSFIVITVVIRGLPTP